MARLIGTALALALVLVGADPASTRAAAQQPRPGAATSAAELDEGGRLLRRGEFFQALTRLRRANDLAGGDCAECLVGMAEAMVGMKVYPNALETIQRVIDLAPPQNALLARAHALRAEVFKAQAETDPSKTGDIERELRAAIALDADDDHMFYDLGVLLMKQGREAEGLVELRRFLDLRDIGPMADDARAIIANPKRATVRYIPEFSLTTVDGVKLTADSLKGKVVLFDFWATWCPPCVDAVPAIRKLQQKYASAPFVIVGVSADNDEGVWRRFTVKNNMIWPQFYDRRRDLVAGFQVGGFPTYVLADREGVEKLRVVGSGFDQSRALADAIDKELQK